MREIDAGLLRLELSLVHRLIPGGGRLELGLGKFQLGLGDLELSGRLGTVERDEILSILNGLANACADSLDEAVLRGDDPNAAVGDDDGGDAITVGGLQLDGGCFDARHGGGKRVWAWARGAIAGKTSVICQKRMRGMMSLPAGCRAEWWSGSG